MSKPFDAENPQNFEDVSRVLRHNVVEYILTIDLAIDGEAVRGQGSVPHPSIS